MSINSLRGSDGYSGVYSLTIDNPVFKVKVRSLDNGNEQPAQKSEDGNIKKDITKEFKVGDIVKGKPFNKNEIYKGKITKFIKNKNGENSSIIINDVKTNKEIKLDPITCFKIEKKCVDKDKEREIPIYGESLFLDLDYFYKFIS